MDYKLIVDDKEFNGHCLEMFTNSLVSMHKYVVPAYRDIIGKVKKRKENGKRFLKDFFGVVRFLNDINGKEIVTAGLEIEKSIDEPDPLKYLESIDSYDIKVFVRQVRGKGDISDVLDFLLGD